MKNDFQFCIEVRKSILNKTADELDWPPHMLTYPDELKPIIFELVKTMLANHLNDDIIRVLIRVKSGGHYGVAVETFPHKLHIQIDIIDFTGMDADSDIIQQFLKQNGIVE